jgi:hypothetical protein
MTREILEHILHQPTLYSVQQCPSKAFNAKVEELEVFIGISLYTSIIQLPSTRHYWSSHLGHLVVYEVMSCNRWEEITRFIQFNDKTTFVPAGQDGYDNLHKIRPFLDAIRQRLLLVPKKEYFTMDEQIIPTKSRSSIKQYSAKKTHKWGYKAFILSELSGFSYDFDILAGAQSNTVPDGAPDLGASSNVVIRLTQSVPQHHNYKIFFDNWFTNVPLKVYLKKEGLLALGTVKANRVSGASGATMPTEKEK